MRSRHCRDRRRSPPPWRCRACPATGSASRASSRGAPPSGARCSRSWPTSRAPRCTSSPRAGWPSPWPTWSSRSAPSVRPRCAASCPRPTRRSCATPWERLPRGRPTARCVARSPWSCTAPRAPRTVMSTPPDWPHGWPPWRPRAIARKEAIVLVTGEHRRIQAGVFDAVVAHRSVAALSRPHTQVGSHMRQCHWSYVERLAGPDRQEEPGRGDDQQDDRPRPRGCPTCAGPGWHPGRPRGWPARSPASRRGRGPAGWRRT